jgi:hypothetical protein
VHFTFRDFAGPESAGSEKDFLRVSNCGLAIYMQAFALQISFKAYYLFYQIEETESYSNIN